MIGDKKIPKKPTKENPTKPQKKNNNVNTNKKNDELNTKKKYGIIVLDLDETLFHTKKTTHF